MDCSLNTVRIFTRDWPRATTYYREILGLEEVLAEESMGWAEYRVGGPTLALERVAEDDAEGQSLAGRFLGVSLEVSDINATYAELSARGVDFYGPPAKQPWGGTLAHFRDLDGNVLTLLESAHG